MKEQKRNLATFDEAKKAAQLAYNKKHYGDLIHSRREALGIMQKELASALGVPPMYVTHWEAGRSRPDLNLIPDLCRALDLSITAFFHQPSEHGGLTAEEEQHLRNYRSLSPRDRAVTDAMISHMLDLSWEETLEHCKTNFHLIFRNYQQAAAGTGFTLDPEASGEKVFIHNTRLSDRADEIVTVNGDSMLPDYPDGQEVYVMHTRALNIGDIGLFVVNGEGYIKQYLGDRLHSLNPDYGDIPLLESDDARIIGKVLGPVSDHDHPTEEEKKILATFATEE